MKKKNHERRKRGAGKKQNSKNSVSESSRKKKSSHHSQHSVTTSEERGSRNKSSTWSFFARIFSCTSNTNSQVVETAHSSRHAPELPPKLSKESILEQKLSFLERNQKLNTIIDDLPPPPPQEGSWRAGDEQKEPFPVIDDDCSVAASELTLDTCFRNQDNNSRNSKDRSWSAVLGFGSIQQQQYQSSPPSNLSHQNNSADRNSGFFGFGGYGSFNQGNANTSSNQQTPTSHSRHTPFQTPVRESNTSDIMEERGMDGSVSQQSAGVKPTRLQQQQASLLMRTQRSIRSNSANNTPLVDPLARPGSFRAMRNSSSNTPQSTTSPPSRTMPPLVHTMSPPSNAVMMVNTGDSDALCDIYPNQDDQMFEEMKLGVHNNVKKGNNKSNDETFSENNPAMKQMKNRSKLLAGHRSRSEMTSPSHPVSPSNSDFYVSSTDGELGAFSTSNSISPKSSSGGGAGKSTFTNPALVSRSQSTPIQILNSGNSYSDSPSVNKSISKSTVYKEPYGKKGDNYELDMQNPMKKAYAAKAAQMARSGTAAGAAASAAVSKGGITNSGGDRPGAVQVSSTDESDMEFAIMLSLQEEQTRKQLEDAERKAVEEAMQRSTINTRPSIRLLQSKYYNSR